MKSQQQQQGLAMVLAIKLSDDLNMSRVTQHSVPRVLMQDQRDDCMSADKDGTFLNWT
jgi:hypothetical protein